MIGVSPSLQYICLKVKQKATDIGRCRGKILLTTLKENVKNNFLKKHKINFSMEDFPKEVHHYFYNVFVLCCN